MEIKAYFTTDTLLQPLWERYGKCPRYRGCEYMWVEEDFCEPEYVGDSDWWRNKFVGESVVRIHTRCGTGGLPDLESSNYCYFGMDRWEKSLGDILLFSCDYSFDRTYRDTYIKFPFKTKQGDE